MIDTYDYIDLFSEHETVHLIIVNSSATVTPVEDSAPTITDADFTLTEANMDGDSIALAEALNESQNLKFGSMHPSKFEIDIFNDISITSLKDDEIKVYIYFDEDSSTLFQVGLYVVKMDEYSDDRETRHLTCFDVLQDLYDYDITKLYNKLYESNTVISIEDLRNAVFEWLTTPKSQTTSMGISGAGYDYTLSQEEVELVNDDFEVEKSIESDVVTFGFLMEGLLEANGVFGHISRTGVFRYISLETYDQDPKRVITEDDSFKPVIYEDYHVWGIGYVAIWDRNNIRIAYEGSSAYSHPSVYNIIDSFVFTNNNSINGRPDAIKQAARNLRDKITHMWYYPIESECAGNLCYEVGDRINLENVTYDEETDGVDDEIPIVKNLYSYILKREFTGLQDFTDIYYATGDRKQPRYKIINDRWHDGDSEDESTSGNDGVSEVNDVYSVEFIRYLRNIGIRLLQEPSNVSVEYVKELGNHHVEIKWTDPEDITTHYPMPCEWKGTIIVRREGRRPYHRWDGTVLVDSTTRDEYSVNPFIDDTIEANKKYYYGIFPYHIHMTDASNSIAYYRFTKIVTVDTQSFIVAPDITNINLADATTVAIEYNIPQLADASYTSIKLVYKKKKIPKSKTDGIAIDLSQSSDSIAVSGLDELTKYYFIIFVEDSVGNKAESDPKDITTGELVKPFKEAVEVLKQTGTDIFTPVYEWTGKWGKGDSVDLKIVPVISHTDILDIVDSYSATVET